MTEIAQGASFPKAHRLRKREDFQKINHLGRKFHTPHFLVFALQENSLPRLGITVSRKVGGAVQRNQVKRYLREYFRTHRSMFLSLGSVSIIAKRGAAELRYQTISSELASLLNKLGNR